MRPFRSLRALLVDVPPGTGGLSARDGGGRAGACGPSTPTAPTRSVAALRAAAGAPCSTAARPAGGAGAQGARARAARRPAPALPRRSPFVHAGDLTRWSADSTRRRRGARSGPAPARAHPRARRHPPAPPGRRRPPASCSPSRRSPTTSPPAWSPARPGASSPRSARRSMSCGAVWRPSDDGDELRCTATWHRANAGACVRRARRGSSCAVLSAARACPAACGRSGARRGSRRRRRRASRVRRRHGAPA